MAVTVEMHNTGDPALRAEVVSLIEHILSDRPGDWRVSIVGSQANDGWELKIIGPNAFERSSTLERIWGEQRGPLGGLPGDGEEHDLTHRSAHAFKFGLLAGGTDAVSSPSSFSTIRDYVFTLYFVQSSSGVFLGHL